jgi:hypothetical protein
VIDSCWGLTRSPAFSATEYSRSRPSYSTRWVKIHACIHSAV